MNFHGDVITKWLQHIGNDRYMELLSDFGFTDPQGVEWIAPTGSKVNGASIPELIWSVVGTPFIGDYRRASVLHDAHCDLKQRPHRQVHRMFYDAMICDGVTPFRAKYMYQAVRLFGPRWDEHGNDLPSKRTGVSAFDLIILNQNLDLSIDELEAKLDQILNET